MQKEQKKRLFFLCFFVIFLGITIMIVARETSLQQIHSAVCQIKPIYFIFGIGLMGVFFFSEAMALFVLLHQLEEPVTLTGCFRYACVGFYFSSITPSSTGGQPAQAYYMKKDGIGLSHSSIVLLISTMAYQFATLCYGLFAYLMKPDLLYSGKTQYIKWLFILGVVVNGIAISFLLCFFAHKNIKKIKAVCFFILQKLCFLQNREEKKKKLELHLLEYEKGIQYIKTNPIVVCQSFAWTFLQIAALYSVSYFVVREFLPHPSFYLIFFIQAILGLAVSSVPLPGGVGAAESGFLILYHCLLKKSVLVPIMVLTRSIVCYLPLFLTGFLVAIFLWKERKYKYEGSCSDRSCRRVSIRQNNHCTKNKRKIF